MWTGYKAGWRGGGGPAGAIKIWYPHFYPQFFLSSPTVKGYETVPPPFCRGDFQLEKLYANLTHQFLPSATLT